jgi:hypothetical protein
MIERRLPLDQIVSQAKAAGVPVSRRTVARRAAEAKAAGRPVKPSPAAASGPPVADLPATPEDIPADVDLETVTRWLAAAERMATAAEQDGNLTGFTSVGRLVKALVDARRELAPPPVANPDDNIDLVQAGQRAATRLHEMIDRAFGPAGPLRRATE